MNSLPAPNAPFSPMFSSRMFRILSLKTNHWHYAVPKMCIDVYRGTGPLEQAGPPQNHQRSGKSFTWRMLYMQGRLGAFVAQKYTASWCFWTIDNRGGREGFDRPSKFIPRKYTLPSIAWFMNWGALPLASNWPWFVLILHSLRKVPRKQQEKLWTNFWDGSPCKQQAKLGTIFWVGASTQVLKMGGK